MSIEAALLGTLGRDAEVKTSSKGKPYLRANIAVSEGEATTWVNAMIFDQAAIESAAKFIKGARVYTLNEWTGQDGRNATAFRSCAGTVAWRKSGATSRASRAMLAARITRRSPRPAVVSPTSARRRPPPAAFRSMTRSDFERRQ